MPELGRILLTDHIKRLNFGDEDTKAKVRVLASSRVCANTRNPSGEKRKVLLKCLRGARAGPTAMTLGPSLGTNMTGQARVMMEKNEICSNFSLQATGNPRILLHREAP